LYSREYASFPKGNWRLERLTWGSPG